MLAVLVVVAAIGATLEYGGSAASIGNSLSAGPLSVEHTRFVGGECSACHAPHDSELGSWVSHAFVGNDMTMACLDCHSFEGEARSAHNFMELPSSDLPDHLTTQTQCISCHTEHNGLDADLTTLSDAQCSTCHQVEMASFADHVAFDPQFPSRQRTAVRFDHVSHLGKHFLQAGENDPTGCIDCHVVGRAEIAVPIRAFAETCASCHAGDIDDRALTVFSLPEMSAEQFVGLDQEYLGELCPDYGSPEFDESLDLARQAVANGDPFGDFESVAFGEGMDPVMQWSMASESADIYDLASDETVVDDLLWLYLDMADSGTSALAELFDERIGVAGTSASLLAGLSDATVRQAVCSWTANEEVFEDPPFGGGWYVDGLKLNYMPGRHADPVMRAWLDMVVVAPVLAADEGVETSQATIMRDTLIDPRQGAGSCARCHAVSAVDDLEEPVLAKVDWLQEIVPWSPYLSYNHGPHLNLLGEGKACVQCHRLNDESGMGDVFETFDPLQSASSFIPIGKDQCVACHGTENGMQAVGAPQGCLLCHDYHLGSSFEHQMVDIQSTVE